MKILKCFKFIHGHFNVFINVKKINFTLNSCYITSNKKLFYFIEII